MSKFARAMQLHALTQKESGRETFQERVSQRQEPQPATQRESANAAADTNGRALHGAPEVSWLFHLAPALREGYLRLSRNLLLSSNGRELKTLVLTSPEEQDERAFVAAEFAAVLATDLGRKVLLVDGDTDRSSLSRLFGRSEHLGLREILLSSNGVYQGAPSTCAVQVWCFCLAGLGGRNLRFPPPSSRNGSAACGNPSITSSSTPRHSTGPPTAPCWENMPTE